MSHLDTRKANNSFAPSKTHRVCIAQQSARRISMTPPCIQYSNAAQALTVGARLPHASFYLMQASVKAHCFACLGLSVEVITHRAGGTRVNQSFIGPGLSQIHAATRLMRTKTSLSLPPSCLTETEVHVCLCHPRSACVSSWHASRFCRSAGCRA